MLAFANIILITSFIVTFRVTPDDVLGEVRGLRSDIKMTSNTLKTAITINKKDIDKIKDEMELRTEQLRRANEKLQEIDATFVPDLLPPP